MVPLTSGIAGPAVVRKATATFLQMRRDAGRAINSWELGSQTINLVTDSNDEAHEHVLQARWQNRGGRALTRRAVVDGQVEAVPYEGEPSDDAFWGGLCYGNPDRVTAQYQALSDAGATFASCWMMVGEQEHARIMKSIRLMGEHVIPALRDTQPPASLWQELSAGTTATAPLRVEGPSG
jgi:hypothetical protein